MNKYTFGDGFGLDLFPEPAAKGVLPEHIERVTIENQKFVPKEDLDAAHALIVRLHDKFGEAAGGIWTEAGRNGLEDPRINQALMDAEDRMGKLGLRVG